MWIAKPNYTKAQFKRLYRIHRQLQSPFFKGKKGDKDFFNRIFDSRTEPDETEIIRERIKNRGKYAKPQTESELGDFEDVDALPQDES